RRGYEAEVLGADPLSDGVELVPAGEDVRGRKAELRQPRAVRPAADRRELRLQADAARRLEGGLDHVRNLVERLAHVAVLVPALEGHARVDRLGEAADESLVLFQLRAVVVAENEDHRRVVGAALDRVRVHEALAALGRLRGERVAREAVDEAGGEL